MATTSCWRHSINVMSRRSSFLSERHCLPPPMLQHSHQTGHQPISFLVLQPQGSTGYTERKQWTPSLKTWSLLFPQHRKMSHVHCADLMVWQSSSVCQPTKLFTLTLQGTHWLRLFKGRSLFSGSEEENDLPKSHTKKSNCWNWHSLLTLSDLSHVCSTSH